jgi:hypothetical protein
MVRAPFRYDTAIAVIMALCATAAPATAAPILSAVSTQTIVDAFAANTFLDSGSSRTTSGSGPMSDSVHESYLTNTADAVATIDAVGLHSDASLLNSVGDAVTGSSRAISSLVDPFMLVGRSGFNGTHAQVEIAYHLTGAVADTPHCESCFEVIQATLSVDGMGQSFFFLGTRSEGTKNNAGYLNGPLDKSGVLVGLLPVNTELFLRASLLTSTRCQSWVGAMCTSDSTADFSFTGVSNDQVDFVWGLEPGERDVPSVPEPASATLLGIGLLLIARRLRATR